LRQPSEAGFQCQHPDHTVVGDPDDIRVALRVRKIRVQAQVAIKEIAAFDIGLVLMPAASDGSSSQWMPGASNKPFDYLASGLAVLVADAPGWCDMFVTPGYGLACVADDPGSVAAALRWCLEHPSDMRAMGERGRRRVTDEWNYETQFAPVREWLELGAN